LVLCANPKADVAIKLGSESAAERRQSYPRKHAVSDSSEILGSEGSRKIENISLSSKW
jgi:hypothetical protein